MARTLDVYLNREICGHLTQEDTGQITFTYLKEWIDGPDAMPPSQSLPLRPERFTRKECSGFFGGILPEQAQRDVIAENLGISKKNDFAMLEQIGGECAGAITFMPAGRELPTGERSRGFNWAPTLQNSLVSVAPQSTRTIQLLAHE